MDKGMESLGDFLARWRIPAEEALIPPPQRVSANDGGSQKIESRFTTTLSTDALCQHCLDSGFVYEDSINERSEVLAIAVPCAHCRGDRQTQAVERRRESAGFPVPEHGGRWTFDAYKGVNEKAEMARETVKTWTMDSDTPWLFLLGTPGTGKTHLACAAAESLVDIGYGAAFHVAPELMNDLRAAIGKDQQSRRKGEWELEGLAMDNLRSRLMDTPVLVLDELGPGRRTEFAQEQLYEIVGHRYQKRMRFIVTTNVDPASLDERIVSRLSDRRICRQIVMEWEDFRKTAVGQ